MNNDIQSKLGSFNDKIENEKKQKLIDESNKKLQEKQEQLHIAKKQEEMKSYVEGKLKTITGINNYTLTSVLTH